MSSYLRLTRSRAKAATATATSNTTNPLSSPKKNPPRSDTLPKDDASNGHLSEDDNCRNTIENTTNTNTHIKLDTKCSEINDIKYDESSAVLTSDNQPAQVDKNLYYYPSNHPTSPFPEIFPQPVITPSSLTNSFSQLSSNTDHCHEVPPLMIHNPTINYDKMKSVPLTKLVTVHHNSKKYYILPHFVAQSRPARIKLEIDPFTQHADFKPTKQSYSCFASSERTCLMKKFDSNTIMAMKHFEVDPCLDPDVHNVLSINRPTALPYTSIDATLLYCNNPSCAKNKTNGATDMHFSCYQHLFSLNRTTATPFLPLVMEEIDLDILCHMGTPLRRTNLSSNILDQLKSSNSNKCPITLPVCGVQCMKNLLSARKKAHKRLNTVKKNRLLNWSSDGQNGMRSSEKILIDWISDQINFANYKGDKDPRTGNTNGHTKDYYHRQIQLIISQETGV